MKTDVPAFKMVVEDGRLVPAAAWDQERLMSYRNHSTVTVRITQEKNRKLERKYWAILNAVIATCGLQQKTAEDLHKAIRLKLGIVEAFFTIDSNLRVDLKSTSTMGDQEYSAFYDDAMALLCGFIGVDPETLAAESADVGDDEDQESSGAAARPDGEGSVGEAGVPSLSPPAADESSDVTNPSSDVGSDGDFTPRAQAVAADPLDDEIATFALMAECIVKFMAVATDASVPDIANRRWNIEFARKVWNDALPRHTDFVKTCFETANKVASGKRKVAPATRYLEGFL